MKIPFLIKLIIGIALCLAAGLIGSLFTSPNIATWYAQLQKPSFAPPNWVFGPVWSFLFILMGISFALVWHSYGKIHGASTAIIIFLVHLVFNILWSGAFFGLRSPLLGLIDIIVLLVLILVTIRYFYYVVPVSSYLLVPYVLWVGFATVLNCSILLLNR